MTKDYSETLAKMSDQNLQRYLTDYLKFESAAVEAAFIEFERRGVPLPAEQIEKIRIEIANRDKKKQMSEAAESHDRNVIDDPSAVELYSEKAVYYMSVFFAPLVGAILIHLNLKSLNKKEGTTLVINFGFVYLAIAGIVLSIFSNSAAVITLNILGSMILKHYFWERYIGPKFLYRKKSISKPFVISLLVSVVLFIANLYSN